MARARGDFFRAMEVYTNPSRLSGCTRFFLALSKLRRKESSWNPRLLHRSASVVFLVTMVMENEGSRTDLVGELMRDVDRTLLRENLKLTPAERLSKFANFMRFTSSLRRAGAKVRPIEAATAKR